MNKHKVKVGFSFCFDVSAPRNAGQTFFCKKSRSFAAKVISSLLPFSLPVCAFPAFMHLIPEHSPVDDPACRRGLGGGKTF
jgi:hypothetical protein